MPKLPKVEAPTVPAPNLRFRPVLNAMQTHLKTIGAAVGRNSMDNNAALIRAELCTLALILSGLISPVKKLL
jgi:hypothetical protein